MTAGFVGGLPSAMSLWFNDRHRSVQTRKLLELLQKLQNQRPLRKHQHITMYTQLQGAARCVVRRNGSVASLLPSSSLAVTPWQRRWASTDSSSGSGSGKAVMGCGSNVVDDFFQVKQLPGSDEKG